MHASYAFSAGRLIAFLQVTRLFFLWWPFLGLAVWFSLQADPELFQFGNHWPLFLELARRALDSADPAVHAKVRERQERGSEGEGERESNRCLCIAAKAVFGRVGGRAARKRLGKRCTSVKVVCALRARRGWCVGTWPVLYEVSI